MTQAELSSDGFNKINIPSKFWLERSFKQRKYKLFTISLNTFSLPTSTFFRHDIDFLILFYLFTKLMLPYLTLPFIKVSTFSDLLHHQTRLHDKKKHHYPISGVIPLFS